MRTTLLLFLALALSLPAAAAQDFQLWSEAGVSLKLSKKWRLQFDGHVRLDRNLSAELFLRIDDPDGALHKWRATAGLDWEIGRHTLSIFYRIEDPLGDPEDPTRHILGTGYHYTF